MSGIESEGGAQTVSKENTRLKHPKMYRVLLLNDDYTTMDFVILVLESVFKKSPAEATKIMLEVHNKGSGVCGVFSRQIAEAKIELVHAKARDAGYPLRCSMNPV